MAWLELYPADRTETVLFGWSIALSDDTAVVGSPRGSGDNGSVYVYSRTEEGWVFHQRLFPGDAHGGAYLFLGFGAGLAISGNTLAVAAPNRISPGGLGAVYIFERQDGQWTEQALITSTDGRPFGLSVALDRNTLVVGGREGRGDALVEAGLAYVFERAGHRWIQQAKLTSSDIPMFNRDGVSVAIDGKTIAVGQTSSHTLPGSVYLFTRKGRDWTQQAQITTPDGLRSFGDSVSLCGETLAVGAPMDGGGSVFIYERVAGAWLMQFGTYSASSVPYGSGSRLGETVVLNKGPNGLELLATAPYQNLARFRYDGSRPGAAWVYPRGPEGWGFAYRLVVPGAMVSPYAYDQDLFGKGAALNGHTVLIGAPLHGDQNSGVAYIIER